MASFYTKFSRLDFLSFSTLSDLRRVFFTAGKAASYESVEVY